MKPLKGSDWVTQAANDDSDDERKGKKIKKSDLLLNY